MSHPFSLQGRVALVTGASRGLGAGMALGLAQAGAHVVLNGRNPAALQARQREITDAGGKASIAPFDVCRRADADAAIDAITDAHGQLDILVNNALTGVPRDFFDISDDDWRASMDSALDACFRLSRKAAAGMVTRGWGRIVMISSVNARISRGTNTAYITAKAGLEGLTRGMAVELAAKGVTVNAIAPGYMATDINTAFRADPARYEWIRNRTPMKRWGTPQDLAGAAVFLASEASAFITGQTLVADGGMTIAI
ncbi:MAG: SDR family oxidoreductase [Burkholderiaceae bacterium]|nr:SDR family oxidoreductase [Rhodoferax sp.]MCW5643724.1 SDR family oxidoreductase [Rhodoferax sp.]